MPSIPLIAPRCYIRLRCVIKLLHYITFAFMKLWKNCKGRNLFSFEDPEHVWEESAANKTDSRLGVVEEPDCAIVIVCSARPTVTWFPRASRPPCRGQSSAAASLLSNHRHSGVSHSGPKTCCSPSGSYLLRSHPFHVLHVEPLEEAPGMAPLCWDHHIVVWLVPEVIPASCKITNSNKLESVFFYFSKKYSKIYEEE